MLKLKNSLFLLFIFPSIVLAGSFDLGTTQNFEDVQVSGSTNGNAGIVIPLDDSYVGGVFHITVNSTSFDNTYWQLQGTPDSPNTNIGGLQFSGSSDVKWDNGCTANGFWTSINSYPTDYLLRWQYSDNTHVQLSDDNGNNWYTFDSCYGLKSVINGIKYNQNSGSMDISDIAFSDNFNAIWCGVECPVNVSTTTASTTEISLLGSINFGLGIIIVLLFLMVVGFVFNNITNKKPWLR